MPSVEELLSQDSGVEYINISPINDVITIDPETRTINLPASETLFGTEQEMNVERKYFKCPKIVGDNIDLSKHQIYITYVTAKDNAGTFLPEEELGLYYCEDMAVDGDYITFSWLLSGNVLNNHGFIAFAVSAKHMDGEVLKTRWKTKPAVGTVLLTVPDGASQIVEAYPDIITQLLDRMNAVEEIATVEAMQGYVNDYLGRNPVQLDPTLTDSTKAAPADLVGELKCDLDDKISNPSTSDNNKFPRAKNGEVEWVEQGLPTDEQTENAVTNWLNRHPEATTTVQDRSVGEVKLKTDLVSKIKNVGINIKEKYDIDNSGNTDVANLLQQAIDESEDGDVLFLPKGIYSVSKGIKINKNIELMGESSFKRPANTPYNATTIKLMNGLSDITVISKGNAERCTLRNLTVASESFYITRTSIIPENNKPGIQIEGHTVDENVNGIDMHNFNGAYIYNCNAYGFSGFGIKTSLYGIADSLWVHYSNVGIIAYNDSLHSNLTVQDCISGISIEGNAVIINGFRCDEISEYGLIITGQHHFITGGFIDQTGFSAIKTMGFVSQCYINIKILRCCGYWYKSSYENIDKNNEHFKDFFRIQVNSGLNESNITINMSDLCGLNDINDKTNDYFSPAYIYTNDVSMYNNSFQFNNTTAMTQKIDALKVTELSKNLQHDNLSKFFYKPSSYNAEYTMQTLSDNCGKYVTLGSDNCSFDISYLRTDNVTFNNTKHNIDNDYSIIKVKNGIAIFTLRFTATENIPAWTLLGISYQKNVAPNNLFRFAGEGEGGNLLFFDFTGGGIMCSKDIKNGNIYTVSGCYTIK